MLATQQPLLKRFWYPVLPIADLEDGPKSFTLMNQPLVVWLDGQGNPAATEDRCCHRSAQLSKGIVVDGHIRCPYHGWEFDSTGACKKVPQLTEDFIPRTYKVSAFPCQARYGYVWVSLSPEPLTGIPDIPEAEDPQFRLIPQFYEVWHCAGLRLMENSFDGAHPHFVHAKSFGDQQNPVPPARQVSNESEWGFDTYMELPVLNPELQQKNLGIAETRTVRSIHSTWFLPFCRKAKITYPNGLIHIIFTAATPIDDKSSQIVQFCVRNDSETDAPAADVIAFDRQVTLEDRYVLEGTDPDVPLDIKAEQHMFSDKPSILMRHKLAALLKAHAEVEVSRR
ncbi:MAG: aromatic ring-hydroxylating dioxygenase subunit alpha [Cyanobacteriota bacterium]